MQDSPSVWSQRHFAVELSSWPVPDACGPRNIPAGLLWFDLEHKGRWKTCTYEWFFLFFSGSRTYWFAITTSYCHLLYLKINKSQHRKLRYIYFTTSQHHYTFCVCRISTLWKCSSFQPKHPAYTLFFPRSPVSGSTPQRHTCEFDEDPKRQRHQWITQDPEAPNPKNNSRRRPKLMRTPNSHDPSGPRPRLTKTPGPLTVHGSIREGGHTQEHVSQWKQLFNTLLLQITTTELT